MHDNQAVSISSDDYIIADLNGVVVLPGHLAEEALQRMERMQAADAKVANALKDGMPFAEASRKFR